MLRARPRRGALGLRGRIVGAVLVTTVATLGVAAVAVLGPLEHELRNKALSTLEKDVSRKQLIALGFKKLALQDILLADSPAQPAGSDLARAQAAGAQEKKNLDGKILLLASKVGVVPSLVNLLGEASASGLGYTVAPSPPDEIALPTDAHDDATRAFLGWHPVYGFGTIGSTEYARAAVPLVIGSAPYVLVVRKPIEDIPLAVNVVRTAFIFAALAGLGLTVILGIPLAATLVRRLRRLRYASLELAEAGPSVELPVDRARDEVGDLSRAFAIMRRRLQQQEEARRAFVATASHELRTPLTSLEGMLELLAEDLDETNPDLEDARSLLERARAQSRRLGRLAADLLDLSRIDAEVQLRSEPVELGELSRAVLAEFELGTAERGLGTLLDDSAGPVWAKGDPGSVARILRILLENAVRVSPAGSELRVELRNGDRATLSVCDQGPGVESHERELIFQRFQRGRQTAGQAGFGLGLAIGRELAERMGGELVLEETDGPGARFTLRLPGTRAPEGELLAV